MAAILTGCVTARNPSDIRPPLMNDRAFTNFVPTIVTNELPSTNYVQNGRF